MQGAGAMKIMFRRLMMGRSRAREQAVPVLMRTVPAADRPHRSRGVNRLLTRAAPSLAGLVDEVGGDGAETEAELHASLGVRPGPDLAALGFDQALAD